MEERGRTILEATAAFVIATVGGQSPQIDLNDVLKIASLSQSGARHCSSSTEQVFTRPCMSMAIVLYRLSSEFK